MHNKRVVYDARSLKLFDYKSRFRKNVVWLTEAEWFDSIVIVMIIVGSICMALYDFSDPNSQTDHNKRLDLIQLVIQCCFTAEASLKIIAMGVWEHKNAYLKDSWNVMDFIVVLMSWVDMLATTFSDGSNLAAFKVFRAMRVIRPLRSVKRVPSMRRLVAIILRSVPDLANTQFFMLFFFLVFGIIGIQNFHGAIYYRCRLTEYPIDGVWEVDRRQANKICAPLITDQSDFRACHAGTFCGSPMLNATVDPLIDNPWQDKSIEYNTVNFNELWSAMVLVFEALTLEGWSTQMKRQIEAGNGPVAVPFFLMLIVFGAYFILNLNLAVIMASFTRYEQMEKDLARQKKEDQQRQADHELMKEE